MKRLLPLLLCAALARGGEDDPARLVQSLGSPSYDEREAAQTALIPLGEKAWPDLEKALESEDMEIRERAASVLRAWGWIPPLLRCPETEALRGKDPERRKATVERFLEEGLKDSLELALAGIPVRLGLTLLPGKRTYEAGQDATLEGEVRNLSKHPGWVPDPLGLEVQTLSLRALGRSVSFPAAKGGRLLFHSSSHG